MLTAPHFGGYQTQHTTNYCVTKRRTVWAVVSRGARKWGQKWMQEWNGKIEIVAETGKMFQYFKDKDSGNKESSVTWHFSVESALLHISLLLYTAFDLSSNSPSHCWALRVTLLHIPHTCQSATSSPSVQTQPRQECHSWNQMYMMTRPALMCRGKCFHQKGGLRPRCPRRSKKTTNETTEREWHRPDPNKFPASFRR